MAHGPTRDWPEGQLPAPAGAWSNRLQRSAQVEAQFRIIVGLRAMYVDLLAEPVPDRLLELIREYGTTETSRHDS
ncbi:NepR family anti-sigma factor [Microvirga massiliensis]|uniref:NepR family anti-sigma factor n=1 Tax=Microvirga massiliensis TaxID=1033741 RepID=UPI00062B8099|nr:NepR family anti-sigma factor [Microvirga massiliensis]